MLLRVREGQSRVHAHPQTTAIKVRAGPGYGSLSGCVGPPTCPTHLRDPPAWQVWRTGGLTSVCPWPVDALRLWAQGEVRRMGGWVLQGERRFLKGLGAWREK